MRLTLVSTSSEPEVAARPCNLRSVVDAPPVSPVLIKRQKLATPVAALAAQPQASDAFCNTPPTAGVAIDRPVTPSEFAVIVLSRVAAPRDASASAGTVPA